MIKIIDIMAHFLAINLIFLAIFYIFKSYNFNNKLYEKFFNFWWFYLKECRKKVIYNLPRKELNLISYL